MAYEVNGTCVDVEVLVMGPIDNNVYLIGDGSATFVVDPCCDAPRILEALGDRTLDAIVVTHAHWDHLGAAAALHEATGAPLVASAIDAPVIAGQKSLGPNHHPFQHCVVDQKVSDGDVVEIGAMRWQVIATPGHTPGSICLFIDAGLDNVPVARCPKDREAGGLGQRATGTLSSPGAPVLVSGDTLFAGTHGRTDFEGGDPAAMRDSLRRLAELPPETIVLPGHNNLTTIACELPWLQIAGIVR